MILLWALLATAQADDPIPSLRATAEAYPEDVAAAEAWARAAAEADDADEALAAWTEVAARTDDAPYTVAPRVVWAVAAGRHALARSIAAQARAADPADPEAWKLTAWAWRFDPLATGVGTRLARAAYRQALALDPDDDDAALGLGLTRLADGDVLGARQVLPRVGDPPTAPRVWTLWGGLRGVGYVYGPDATYAGGGGVTARVGATFDHLVHLDATVRTLHLTDPTGTEDDLSQQDVFVRAGVHHDGHGAEVMTGLHVQDGAVGEDGGPGGYSVAGRAWGTWHATLEAGAWVSVLGDGLGWGVNPRLHVPVTRWVRLTGGLVATGRTAPPGAPTPPPTAVAGHAGLSVFAGPVEVSAAGHWGPQIRPIRFDEPVVWTIVSALTASATGRVAWQIDDHWRVDAGYAWVRSTLPLESTSTDLHLVDVGFTVAFDRATPRQPSRPEIEE